MGTHISKSKAAALNPIGKGTLQDLIAQGLLTTTSGRDRTGKPIDLIDVTQLEALGYRLKDSSKPEFLEERVDRVLDQILEVRAELALMQRDLAEVVTTVREALTPVETSSEPNTSPDADSVTSEVSGADSWWSRFVAQLIWWRRER